MNGTLAHGGQFKSNTALVTEENWHLKGHMPKVKNKCSYFLPHSVDEQKTKCNSQIFTT